MTACITGCTTRGRHLTTCETRDAEANRCRGCTPRDAEFGQLCAWDWQRLNADVIDAPELVRHLREMAQPTAGAKPPSDGRGHGDPAESSVLSGAVDAADGVHATLAAWAHIILEEHPDRLGMRGPDERGAVITQQTLRRNEDGVYVQKATVWGIRDAEATARLVKWLLPLLGWCAAQEWAGEMRREIGDVVRTTMARWPIAETRTRPLVDTLCPRCDHGSLVYTPPSAYRAPFVVACINPECGRIFTEDEWTRLVELLGIAERRVG